jgi:enoyl-[acyl-carrier-protein] reductase (NADH)
MGGHSVYYLLSPMSSHVTGQIINVDGGVSRKFGYNRDDI